MPGLGLTVRADPESLPELMDQPCTFEEQRACLRDIAWVNRLTLAHRPTLRWLGKLVEGRPQRAPPLQIVDVGCGYGDSLRRIHGWAAQHGVAVSLTGIDLNADAVRAAMEATPATMQVSWVHGDAFSYQPADGIDVVLSSLLTHHLAEAEIVRFLRWMETTARRGWFVNDLHRKVVPYRAFQLLAKVMPLHRFVKHDGLVSIQRSFLAEDWQRLCAAAGLRSGAVMIGEYRPARLCVGRTKL